MKVRDSLLMKNSSHVQAIPCEPVNSLPPDITEHWLCKRVVRKSTSQPTAGREQGKAVWRGELFFLGLWGIFAQSSAATGPSSDSSAALRMGMGVRPAAA